MNYEKYKNTLPYGLSAQEKEQIIAENKAKLEAFVGTKKQYDELEFLLNEDLKKRDKESKRSWQVEENRLREEFWLDAFFELGIPMDHPRAELLKSKAWAHGHSSGYSEVFYWLSDLGELI